MYDHTYAPTARQSRVLPFRVGVAFAGVIVVGLAIVAALAVVLAVSTRERPHPVAVIAEHRCESTIGVVDGEADAGVQATCAVRNEGAPGVVRVAMTLSCSEGRWTREQDVFVPANATQSVSTTFFEPSIAARDVQVSYEATPGR